MRILITGAKGQLGQEIRKKKDLLKEAEFYFTDIDELDISNEKEVSDIIRRISPSWLVNCAAYTAVDRAEKEPAEAFAINASAVSNIVTAAKYAGDMKLIHISSDFVFDGKRQTPYTEDNTTGALSVYGKSKQKGEEYALSYPPATVIRTSWLYSEFGSNFVKTILRLSAERDEINVINDQAGSPTWAADLATAVIKIISDSEENENNYIPGLYHYSNEGSCSWHEFAEEIKRIQMSDLKINAVSTAEYPLPAKRPAYSVLCSDKIKKIYNIDIPYWKKSLEKCIQNINRANERTG